MWVPSGVEMKTSLLALVLTTGLGAAGVVQATETTPVPSMPNESRSLAAVGTSVEEQGALSTLDSMLSSGTRAATREAGDAGMPDYVDQPGPALQEAGTPRHQGHAPAAATPDHEDAAPQEPASRGNPSSSLGWQSLLPGSIQ